MRSYTPVVPFKTIPDSDQNEQSLHPFSDQNGARTLPFRAAHTYTACTGGGGGNPRALDVVHFCLTEVS